MFGNDYDVTGALKLMAATRGYLLPPSYVMPYRVGAGPVGDRLCVVVGYPSLNGANFAVRDDSNAVITAPRVRFVPSRGLPVAIGRFRSREQRAFLKLIAVFLMLKWNCMQICCYLSIVHAVSAFW